MVNQEQLEKTISNLLEQVGENPQREGLLETPKRVAKAWKTWAGGYDQNPKDIMKTFNLDDKKQGDQLVTVKNIDYYSMCEHHLAPFYGKVHIGYLPNGKVLGVSKFARLTDIFARRLQIQERLTSQIAHTIMEELDPIGVGVVMTGVHLCMRSRGVEKQGSEMTTSCMLGAFREDNKIQKEFMDLVL